MVVGFTTVYAISTYHHWRCEFDSHSGDTTLFDKGCRWLATGLWFSPGTPVSSTNKTDRHDITEILLKVALNTINHPNQPTIKRDHSVLSRISVTFTSTCAMSSYYMCAFVCLSAELYAMKALFPCWGGAKQTAHAVYSGLLPNTLFVFYERTWWMVEMRNTIERISGH